MSTLANLSPSTILQQFSQTSMYLFMFQALLDVGRSLDPTVHKVIAYFKFEYLTTYETGFLDKRRVQ